MSVFGIVMSVAGFFRCRFPKTDNMVFQLHYKVTTALLFLFCIIVCANNLFGAPIQCINDRGVPPHVINTYCWITYTFTLPHEHGVVGTHVAHPGLGNDIQEKRYHSYYQWVPFVLFFQGILFYVPHWIWKNWEEGKILMILRGLLDPRMGEKHSQLAQYIIDTRRMHNVYAFGYLMSEAFNFINVVGNIFFTDKFLGGAFLTYGSEVVAFSNMIQENRTDPMIAIFPRVTKCTFHKYGPSGSLQKHDALCVLALNIINEKIYIFLWFWFIILAVLTGLSLAYSCAIFAYPKMRIFTLKKNIKFAAPGSAETIVLNTHIGEYLLLHMLGKNLSIPSYSRLLNELATRLNYGNNSNSPSAPSKLEMSPIYPEVDKYVKDTEI